MGTLARNKRAFFDYDILETYQAGIVLEGQEVKSIKTGHINIEGSFVTIHKGDLQLLNAHIPAYKFAKAAGYDPHRSRRLLLTKKEIRVILGRLSQKGLTMVPLKVFGKKRLIKLEIGFGPRPKKKKKSRGNKKKKGKTK